MDAYTWEPIQWDFDLTRHDWRIEASLGVNKGRPFAGVRLARYATNGIGRTRRFQIWEESLLVIPSTPRTAIIAIGNVLSGAINQAKFDSVAGTRAHPEVESWIPKHRK